MKKREQFVLRKFSYCFILFFMTGWAVLITFISVLVRVLQKKQN